jgi:hypothetical protein
MDTEKSTVEARLMKQSKKEVVSDRRSFLKMAGIGAAAGGAALVTGEKKAVASEVKAEGGALYRETDHIRRYYELAR